MKTIRYLVFIGIIIILFFVASCSEHNFAEPKTDNTQEMSQS